jgi:hypothetical protein
MREPRDPLLKVVYYHTYVTNMQNITFVTVIIDTLVSTGSAQVEQKKQTTRGVHIAPKGQHNSIRPEVSFNNDPSAGSPTETLLRLLLPLNDQV